MPAPSTVSAMLGSVAFARLPDELKSEVKALYTAMLVIDKAQRKAPAIHAQSLLLSQYSGTSPKRLEAKYYAWKRAGRDWRSLVNRAKMPDETAGLPPAFIEHWREYFLTNGRKGKPAWRAMIAHWRAGHPIPGYDGRPEVDPLTDLPYGWTYANLMRPENRPTKFETAAARIGRSDASKYRPKVPMTRVGLSVGEYYMFDDMWHDFQISFPGQRGGRRILSLHGHDLLSADLFAAGHKSTMYNETEAKMERLKEKEMVFLLLHVLSNIGYRGEGCTLIVEHGTAACPERLEKALYDWSGGLITVERGGIANSPLCSGMFAGPSKGNFRFKAWLESLHNLIHNETANMLLFPGQTGSNSRLNAPEELHGRERYMRQLIKAGENISEAEAAKIVLPYLEYAEAIALIEQVYDGINSRTDHQLEGWAKCGFTRPAFRLDPSQPWQDASALQAYSPERQAAIQAYIAGSPELFRSVNLSPRQVHTAGARHLSRIPSHILPQLFGPELGREVKVGADNLISFTDRDIDDERLHYETLMIDPHGREILLRAGSKHLGFVNPRDPSRLYLCDAKGGYQGYVQRLQRVCRSDSDALQRACGRAAKIEKQLLAPVIHGQRGAIQQTIATRRNNAGIFKSNPGKRRKLKDDFAEFTPHPEQAQRVEGLSSSSSSSSSGDAAHYSDFM